MPRDIPNPGSALGEAIGATIEEALNDFIGPLVKSLDCVYVTSGPINVITGKYTKLILTDEFGNEYNIDSLVTDKESQPLILIESKYIRYTKHNRDKASWVCNAHSALRRRFSSIRSSITILAGNWSRTSKEMLNSYNVKIFEIPFETICSILSEYDIDFNWGEKERDKAKKAWEIFDELDSKTKSSIGKRIIGCVQKELKRTITQVLDNSTPRNIVHVEIQIMTNLGETKIYKFEKIEEALEFLDGFDPVEIIDTSKSPTMFEKIKSDEDE